MPRVDAWVCKSTGKLFVADRQVEAWQCSSTGKLFDDKECYDKHVRQLRAQRRRELARRRRIDEAQAHVDELFKCSSLPDIEQWLNENAQALANRVVAPQGRVAPKIEFRDVYLDVVWKEMCSNSHSAPIGKKTNWAGREPDIPRGYPGWIGRITLTYPNHHAIKCSELLRVARLCTGSGGGAKNVCFDVTLWEEDWPSLAVMRKMMGSV